MILNDEVMAVLTAIVSVACVLAAALSIPRSVEPFLALGLLGEKGKIGDYPTRVLTGEPVRLNIFVMNHIGRAAALKVIAKLGSRGNIPSNSTPLNATPIWEYTIILNHGQNVTIPVQLTIEREGVNLALVFELWALNTTSGTWVYTGRWNHLYINVTKGVP
ncbi:MAG: DUF1616 domain-containing protein [Thermofilaceae archaeon]